MRSRLLLLGLGVLLSLAATAAAARLPRGGTSAHIEYVVDGDTVQLTNGRRVRLVQIDTPEVYNSPECYGRQASEITKRLLPPGTAVRLYREPKTDAVDAYGRLLRYVFRTRDGLDVNLDLVRVGAAAPYFFDYRRGRYARELIRLARRARARHLGLWGRCPGTPWDPNHGVSTGPPRLRRGDSDAVLFDDQVALSSLDDGLAVEVFVPRRDEEPERVLSHLLEDGGIDLDRDRAAGVRTFTHQRHQAVHGQVMRALLKFRDAKVDLAEQLLIAGHALFPGRHQYEHGIREPPWFTGGGVPGRCRYIETPSSRHLAMLRILYGACAAALDAFHAADNPIDEELVVDLEKMVERTRGEIERLSTRGAES